MALVKNPLMSVEARGTTAGVTFTKTYAGWVAKAKPHPARSLRGTRPRIRSFLGYLSRQWGELTDLQRESWRDWALDHPGTNKFGDPFIMSGFNAFIMINHSIFRLFPGSSMSVLPPTEPPASSIKLLTAVTGAVNPGEVDLSWTELGAGTAGDGWEIQVAGPFLSQGRVEVIGRFAYVTKVAGNVLLVTIPDLDELMWYWFRVRFVDGNGQVTAWDYAQATPKVTV